MDLEGDLRTIGRLRPGPAIHYIRQAVGYDTYLKEFAAFRRSGTVSYTHLCRGQFQFLHPLGEKDPHGRPGGGFYLQGDCQRIDDEI